MRPTPIPFTVIGGFLGAGKTTLLNHLIRHTADRRLAVLVNDFGAISIDADLVVEHDGETVELRNGCVCCDIGGGLMGPLMRLLETERLPDHIVVEASGVALPQKLADVARLDPALYLDAVIVVADCERLCENAADPYVGETVTGQLAAADLIVMSKGDVATDDAVARTSGLLDDMAPRSPRFHARLGDVPSSVLLGRGASPDAAAPTIKAHGEFRSVAIETGRSFARDALEAALCRMPRSVLRVKGVIATEENDRETILQRVGNRTEWSVGGKWGNRARTSRVLAIGTSAMPDAEVRALIEGALS